MWRYILSLCSLALIVSLPHKLLAQNKTPSPSGLYETYSPVFKRPVGKLSSPPLLLPRWLDVKTTGNTSKITFQPDGRVNWILNYGPYGLTKKVANVDGSLFLESRFIYDAQGKLIRKEVSGPGVIAGPWVYTYQTDSKGRVIKRSGKLTIRRTWGSRKLAPRTITEHWQVHWGKRIKASYLIDGEEVRLDTYDSHGRVLRTDWMTRSNRAAKSRRKKLSLIYKRRGTGTLKAVQRVIDGRSMKAVFTKRYKKVTSSHLRALYYSLIERFEARLLLGDPVTHSDSEKGVSRHIVDTYSDRCWLEQTSSLEYDGTGLLVAPFANCICGFCVDAKLPVEARDVEGVDLHWTSGPWVRLNDTVDVTGDHEVMTPDGPRPASKLSSGDEVFTAKGGRLRLFKVEVLPRGEEKLGRNVRTKSGTFGAGGILFKSEPLCSSSVNE